MFGPVVWGARSQVDILKKINELGSGNGTAKTLGTSTGGDRLQAFVAPSPEKRGGEGAGRFVHSFCLRSYRTRPFAFFELGIEDIT